MYFITFISDCTKYYYVYLLKNKDEVLDKVILYKNKIENQLSKKIKVVRSDYGSKYLENTIENMKLFTKLLHLILLSKMVLLNKRIVP